MSSEGGISSPTATTASATAAAAASMSQLQSSFNPSPALKRALPPIVAEEHEPPYLDVRMYFPSFMLNLETHTEYKDVGFRIFKR